MGDQIPDSFTEWKALILREKVLRKEKVLFQISS